jgi:predicted NAD/FAD-dependent oxidoreductase
MTANQRRRESTAIIGAGLAGLTAAGRLARHGHRVALFDKGRRPGGRMSTRRAKGYRFDHGAQYFTANDERFRKIVEGWVRAGVAAPWETPVAVVESARVLPAPDVQRYVGTPDMDAVITYLASNHDVSFSTRVSAVSRTKGRWTVTGEEDAELGRYDTLLVALPPAQVLQIVGPGVSLTEPLRSISMLPCWTVMGAFDSAVDLPFDAALVRGSPLSWVARNNSKPQRSVQECWVLHASADWSMTNIDLEHDQVREALLDAFSTITGAAISAPLFAAAHRWRYARAAEPLGVDSLRDPELALGSCGDWCIEARVEAAFLSGWSLAGKVLAFEK